MERSRVTRTGAPWRLHFPPHCLQGSVIVLKIKKKERKSVIVLKIEMLKLLGFIFLMTLLCLLKEMKKEKKNLLTS